ncbi:restriction endonuclease subunit S [Armatimonas sp.]|uniref:restriction endonuclease subunit S n=1 Tax=Armatimonas sp. TaxID=1872638 RepID=UPI0037537FB8
MNEEFRYDAEYFKKQYLKEDSALSKWKTDAVGAFAFVTDGPHGYHVVDEDSPVIMLTAKNARGWFSEEDGAEPIHQNTHLANQRSSLKENDIILSTRGTVGLCALVTSEVLPANIDQDVARIAPSEGSPVLPEFLLAYLNSTFGQDHIKRNSTGMVQQGLSLSKVRQIPIPQIGKATQEAIAFTVLLALKLRREVKAKRESAEQILLQALGLENWSPPEPLSYTRKSSEVWEAGRLDSQYFTPDVDALREELSQRFVLVEVGKRVTKGVTVPYYEDGTIPIIRSGDLADISDDERFQRTHPTEAVFELKRGDVLISSIGFGSIGKVQVFDKPGKYGTVSEVSVIRQEEFNPYYLTLFLRSKAGQMQIEKYITGATGQLHLYPRDITKIFIPVLPPDEQKAFETLALSAGTARRTAAELLERAKRAVEIAIEQSEEAALEYLHRP